MCHKSAITEIERMDHMQKTQQFTLDELVSMENFNKRIATENDNIDEIDKAFQKLDITADNFNAHKADKKSHLTQENKNRWDNIANINLLINGDFKVWQRGNGIALQTNKWTYTADRFRARGVGLIQKTHKGLYVSSASGTINIDYVLEDEDYIKLLGKTITVSYCKNDIEYILYSSQVAGNNIFGIDLKQGDTLNWAKAELGASASPFVAKSYAQELTDCQRYYRETPFMQSGFSSPDGNTAISWGIVNTNMRIMPNVSVKSLLNPIDAGKIDLIKMFGSGSSILPNFVMSNVGISRVILLLPAGFNGMQGILIEDAEIY